MHQVAGRYVLEGQLGEGGMGRVFRARHKELGKAFALKIISPTFAADAEARERFNLEAKIASEISHPNIVSIVDYGEDPALGAYMVMELVEGEPLLTVDSSAPSQPRRVLDILGQVADALDHIHKHGIVHGDVKAENILLAAEPGDGQRRRRVVRLLDFGLARRHGAADAEVNGSPHYLAPERALGGPPSVASDIYALGVLGYLLFTRTLPFDGEVVDILNAHVSEPPPSMSSIRDDIAPEIEALITRAMAKDPAVRPASAAAFRYEVNTVMDMLSLRRRSRNSSLRMEIPVIPETDSPFPQAVVTADGTIKSANQAFEAFVGASQLGGVSVDETALGHHVPGLLRTIRRTFMEGRQIERRVEVAQQNLVICTAPSMTNNEFVHVLVHSSTPGD